MGQMKWLWAAAVVGVLAVSGLTVWGALQLVGGVEPGDEPLAATPTPTAPSQPQPQPKQGQPQDTIQAQTTAPATGGASEVPDIPDTPSALPSPTAEVSQATHDAIDAVRAAAPPGVIDPTALLNELTFEPVDGFIAQGRYCAALRGLTAEELATPHSYDALHRVTPKPGWTLWRVRYRDPDARGSGSPMVWFDDGSPGVVVSHAMWFDDEADIPDPNAPFDPDAPDPYDLSTIELILVAPQGASPAAAYDLDADEGTDAQRDAHTAAACAEMAGRALSQSQAEGINFQFEHSPNIALLDHDIAVQRLAQLTLGMTPTLALHFDQDAAQTTREMAVSARPSDWEPTYEMIRLLARLDHPALPGVLAQIDSFEHILVAMYAAGPGIRARWRAGDGEAVLKHLLELALQQPDDRDPDFSSHVAQVIYLLANLDPDRGMALAFEMLGHERQRVRWDAAETLIALTNTAYESYRMSPTATLDTSMFDREPETFWRAMADDWPAGRHLRDQPTFRAIADVVRAIEDPQERCVLGMYLLLGTWPEVPLATAIDLLEENAMERVAIRLPTRGHEWLGLTKDNVLAACVAAGYRAGIERLAGHGVTLELQPGIYRQRHQLETAFAGGDLPSIQALLDAGADEALVDDDQWLYPYDLGEWVLSRGDEATLRFVMDRWGSRDMYFAWFHEACKVRRPDLARVLLDAIGPMDPDNASPTPMLRSAAASGDPGLLHLVAGRLAVRGPGPLDEIAEYAADLGDAAMLDAALALGADPEDACREIGRCDEWLSEAQVRAMVAALVANGIDLDAGFEYNPPLLFMAYYAEDVRLARALLDHGANPNAAWSVDADLEPATTVRAMIDGHHGRYEDPAAMALFRRLLAR